jgi:hypothetical protein
MRARGSSLYPELFSQPDESKIAQKMLELALSQVFLGLDENPTDLAPTVDKTHKKQEYDQLEGHNTKAPGYAYND